MEYPSELTSPINADCNEIVSVSDNSSPLSLPKLEEIITENCDNYTKLSQNCSISLAGSSNASSQIDLSTLHANGLSDGTTFNEIESKYLEEQANLKKSLDESHVKCNSLEEKVAQKDEIILRHAKEKLLLEKEKSLVRLVVNFISPS